MNTLTLPDTFNDTRLDIQLAKIERTRIIIFLIVILTAFTTAIVDSLLIGDEIERIFNSMADYYKIVLGGQVMAGHLIMSLIHINRRIKRNKGVLFRYKIMTTIIESTLPSMVLIYLLVKFKYPVLIDTPIIFFYIPILIISILHLDYRITTLCGLLIVIFYGISLELAMGYNADASQFKLQLPEPIYYIRCFILLIATGCAAFVSHRFRKLLESRVKYEGERNQMEQLFSQQVSKQVVDALIENQDVSERREVTILFLDIRGFTNFAQSKEPEEVISFQNQFFSPLIRHH